MPKNIPNQMEIEGADKLPRLLRPEFDRPGRSIVFVCHGNTCRSPMAAVLFNYLAPKFQCPDTASSAGTAATAGYPMSRDARRALFNHGVMPEKNHDYGKHKARVLTRQIIDESDEIVAVSSWVYDKLTENFGEDIAPKLTRLPREIEDPFGMPYSEYVRCMETIELAIREKYFA